MHFVTYTVQWTFGPMKYYVKVIWLDSLGSMRDVCVTIPETQSNVNDTNPFNLKFKENFDESSTYHR